MKQKKLNRLRATAERLAANAERNRILGSNECDALLELSTFALAQIDRLDEKKVLKYRKEKERERLRGTWPDESNPAQHGDDIPQPGEIWEFWQLNERPERIVIPKSGAYPKTMFRKVIDR